MKRNKISPDEKILPHPVVITFRNFLQPGMAGWWFPGLLFIALAPMIFIEDHILNNNQNFHRFSVFTYTFPGFAVWNALTTYWIYNSTPFGGIAAVLFNAFLMAIVFQIWHWIRKYIKSRTVYLP